MSQHQSPFEEKLYEERRAKLAQIAALVRAQDPAITDSEAKYPNSFHFTHTIPQLRELGDPQNTEELAAARIEAAIAGRIMAIRVQGKAGFATLQQGGQRLQIYVRRDDVGDDLFSLYKLLDLGDHIGVRGYVMRTRTGELTLHAAPIHLPGHKGKPAIVFLAKAMLALPDKYHGLEDVELRYRQRYVDLIMNSGTLTKQELPAARNEPGSSPVTETAAPNEEHEDAPRNVREVFVKRAAVLRAIRRFFDARGYLEVETPMLHTIAGGAAARPFKTHHNALDIPLSLRIAPELYLKRLVVGGLDRVYEINRNFRNEGVSTQHNPEFTMLEFYQAYANYHDLMDLTQELIQFVAMEVNGTTKTWFNGTEIDLSQWTKLSMREAIIKFWPPEAGASPELPWFDDEPKFFRFLTQTERYLHGQRTETAPGVYAEPFGMVPQALWPLAQAVENGYRSILAEEHGSAVRAAIGGKTIAAIFEIVAEPHLIRPTIIYDFPLAVSPLSKIKPDEPDWVERFEFYIGGFEVGNAFSELNDPDDQRRRFEAQLAERERGDDEAHAMDEDYVRALGYGLPPTAGEGIGIDRLTMLLTGSRSIRDVILFPLMRPHAKPAAEPHEATQTGSAATPSASEERN